MNKFRIVMAAILGTGVLLSGIGTGVALKEYSALKYTGEHVIGKTDIQTKNGEIKVNDADHILRIIYNDNDNMEIVENESVPDGLILYSVTYNANAVDVLMHADEDEDEMFVSFQTIWQNDDKMKTMMQCKDHILKELKQGRIGSYRYKGIENIKLMMNSEMKQQIHLL